MKPERSPAFSERSEEVFYAALERKSPRERKAFLDDVCAGNPNLRDSVERLLNAQPDADRFFGESSAALKPDTSISGHHPSADEAEARRIGTCRILRKLGEGGCAVVYMAEQEEPVRRTIALKIIKRGMDSKAVIARFEAERQALAMMNHPNIARVYHAGETDTGRPYFIMELVRGIRITDYCDRNRLNILQRLDLFLQVCSAIQHAHQKGIIHRDIKPSNVLVSTGDPGTPGFPKIIDFGIAKATAGQHGSDRATLTATGPFLGTPAYMSPEQATAGGRNVDTRSDLYSLGALFYELLTGRPPFDTRKLMNSGLDEMLRILRQDEPSRPSAAVASLPADILKTVGDSRGCEPAKLAALLRGDLDWIAMRALEKDMGRRYQTANAFTLDIQRHLRNEPVSARPPTRRYRLVKLVRRNRGVFAAITAVAAALFIGLGTSTWLFLKEREARREQVELRELAEIARANEAVLRREAEARENITQAALLVRYQRYEAADRLLEEIDVPVTSPSIEATEAFGTLGDWHALAGRWPEAASRLNTFVQVNQFSDSDMTDTATRGLLRAGPAIAAAGDGSAYTRFVARTVARFSLTTNPIAAEQVLKTTLILPPSPDILDSLKPLAELAEYSLAHPASADDRDPYLAAWRTLALALFEYRRGDFQRSLEWVRQSEAYGQPPPTLRELNRILRAMNRQRLGNREDWRADLALSRQRIDHRFTRGLEQGNPANGFWHDWVMARTLLKEAEALGAEPGDSSATLTDSR